MTLIFSILLAVLLIGSSYIITEKNARYYLTGYWNLTPAEREKVDLRGYLLHWKRTMLRTGIVLVFTGAVLNFTIESPLAIICLITMAVLSFPVLVITGRKYWH